MDHVHDDVLRWLDQLINPVDIINSLPRLAVMFVNTPSVRSDITKVLERITFVTSSRITHNVVLGVINVTKLSKLEGVSVGLFDIVNSLLLLVSIDYHWRHLSFLFGRVFLDSLTGSLTKSECRALTPHYSEYLITSFIDNRLEYNSLDSCTELIDEYNNITTTPGFQQVDNELTSWFLGTEDPSPSKTNGKLLYLALLVKDKSNNKLFTDLKLDTFNFIVQACQSAPIERLDRSSRVLGLLSDVVGLVIDKDNEEHQRIIVELLDDQLPNFYTKFQIFIPHLHHIDQHFAKYFKSPKLLMFNKNILLRLMGTSFPKVLRLVQ
ncbi:hypothetical protein SAMD00019534_015960 [Acytostelium subglobosum LB1]|uniref:hypothetical protein n=1 Tax=Acytostelium subglobosum LB1 TaxID=1410327 RepID=UPI0006450A62|nr:hypothetical protein SAMD00019534_015960 [Acytostelium subglobosum LB1]GAM18421.1 hypothetical protein SAMD00019534_015960 [Acytostelium subglobosum LB1]|eukprot:XP_012757641.1 hypothetical protein SAMD00019534_015960 [Acytostelium subglobosum LB1]